MSDLIDRQAAIDALKEYFSDEDRTDTEYGAYWHHKHVLDVLRKLPSAQPERRWIPCSERLPKRGKDVLVTRDYDGREDNNKSCRYVEVASCYEEDDDITWCSFSDEYKMKPRNHHVIAWMPLPEPYTERR